MLRPATHIRYHITAILAVHWVQFVAQYKRWIRPVDFENVRKVLTCRTPVLGCHIYQCKGCGHVELIHHSCKSRFFGNWNQLQQLFIKAGKDAIIAAALLRPG